MPFWLHYMSVTYIYQFPKLTCFKFYTMKCSDRHLLFDPNLIIQLLYTDINLNSRQLFSKAQPWEQPFHPQWQCLRVSNNKKILTYTKQPLILSRYIDDIIFLIWTDTEAYLKQFLADLNNFNPAIQNSN